ncbi:hypothetical protein GYA19_02200, partial [Candidatus Beckwithbacteria bacterium]|nr:hypothetical protein [Candidatus Beckwithbacteria bacterium]
MLPEKIEINRQPVFQITNNNPDLIFDTTPIDGGNTLKGSDSYSIAYGHTKGYRRLNVSRFDDYNGLIIYQNNDEENEVFCGYFPLASPIPGYPYLQEILVDAAFLGFNGVTVKYLGHPDRLILENLEQKIISLST